MQVNMLESQAKMPFPMSHPLQSQISYKSLFPNFVSSEDPKRGQPAFTGIIGEQAPAQIDKMELVKKTSGFPFRHEVRYNTLPTQRSAALYNDKELYQVMI